MRNPLDATTRAAAVRMLRAGAEPEKVIDFIYGIGYLNGGLDFAKIGEKVGAEIERQREAV